MWRSRSCWSTAALFDASSPRLARDLLTQQVHLEKFTFSVTPRQPARLACWSEHGDQCESSLSVESAFTSFAARLPRMHPRTSAPNIRAIPTSKINGVKSVVQANTPIARPVMPRMTAAVCIPGRAARFPATQASGDAIVARVRSPAQRFGPSAPVAVQAATIHMTTAPTIGSTLSGAARPIGNSSADKSCTCVFTTSTLVLPLSARVLTGGACSGRAHPM
jgi:hypothetical protein